MEDYPIRKTNAIKSSLKLPVLLPSDYLVLNVRNYLPSSIAYNFSTSVWFE